MKSRPPFRNPPLFPEHGCLWLAIQQWEDGVRECQLFSDRRECMEWVFGGDDNGMTVWILELAHDPLCEPARPFDPFRSHRTFRDVTGELAAEWFKDMTDDQIIGIMEEGAWCHPLLRQLVEKAYDQPDTYHDDEHRDGWDDPPEERPEWARKK